MTREELAKFIESEAREIVELFKRKNQSYGNDKDAFYNFRETAKRIWWEPLNKDYRVGPFGTMFKVLLSYVDKHYVALCNRGLADPEVAERLHDIIVYCLIGLAMVKEVYGDGPNSHASGASASAAEAS